MNMLTLLLRLYADIKNARTKNIIKLYSARNIHSYVHKKNPFKERHFTKYMLTFCKFVVKTIVYGTELFSLSAPLRRQRTQLLGS